MTTIPTDPVGKTPINANPLPPAHTAANDVKMSEIAERSILPGPMYPPATIVEIHWLNTDDIPHDQPKPAGVRRVVWIDDADMEEIQHPKNLLIDVIDRICTAAKAIFKHLFENKISSSINKTREVLGCSKKSVSEFQEVLKRHKDTPVEVNGEIKTVGEVYHEMIHNISKFRNELSNSMENSQLFDLQSLKNETLDQIMKQRSALSSHGIDGISDADQKVWNDMMNMLLQSVTAGNHQIHTDGMRIGILDLHYQPADLLDPNFPERMKVKMEDTSKNLNMQVTSGIQGRYARTLQSRIIEPFKNWNESKGNEREKGFSSLFRSDYPKAKAVWEQVRYNNKDGLVQAIRKVSFLSENGGMTEAKVKIDFHDLPNLSELDSIKFMEFITNLQAMISQSGSDAVLVKEWIMKSQQQGYNETELIQSMPECLKDAFKLFDFASDSNKILLVRKAVNFVYDISCALTRAQLTSAPAVSAKSTAEVNLLTQDLAQKSLSETQSQKQNPAIQTNQSTRKYVQIDDNDIPVELVSKKEKKTLFGILTNAVSSIRMLFSMDAKIDKAFEDIVKIMGLSKPESLEKAEKIKELIKVNKDGVMTRSDGTKITLGQAVLRIVALVSKLRDDLSSGKDEKIFNMVSNPNALELGSLVLTLAFHGGEAIPEDDMIVSNFLKDFSQFGQASNTQIHTDSTLIGILDLHYRGDDLTKSEFVDEMRKKLGKRHGAVERAFNWFIDAATEWKNNPIPEERNFIEINEYTKGKSVWSNVVYNSKDGLVQATRVIAYKKENGNVSETKVKLNFSDINPIMAEEESIKFMEFITAIEHELTGGGQSDVLPWLLQSRDPEYSNQELLNNVPEPLKKALQKLNFANDSNKALLVRKAVDFVHDITVGVARAQLS